jgi:tRNA dimethylallyltransferase
MQGIPHHLIDCLEPDENLSCADYVPLARAAIDEVRSRGRLPILCGGTGLYLDSLLRGGDWESDGGDPSYRQELEAFAEREGNQALHDRLREIDPAAAEAIHPNNRKRVIRALEIGRSGVTKTEWDRRSKEVEAPYDAFLLGIRYTDREILYGRIDRRVDAMLEAGLAEETLRLEAEGVFEKNRTAAQAIGYKELLGWLHGEESREEAVERLKRATRQYAKRQGTWFRANPTVHWIDADPEGRMRTAGELFDEAERLVRSWLQN